MNTSYLPRMYKVAICLLFVMTLGAQDSYPTSNKLPQEVWLSVVNSLACNAAPSLYIISLNEQDSLVVDALLLDLSKTKDIVLSAASLSMNANKIASNKLLQQYLVKEREKVSHVIFPLYLERDDGLASNGRINPHPKIPSIVQSLNNLQRTVIADFLMCPQEQDGGLFLKSKAIPVITKH